MAYTMLLLLLFLPFLAGCQQQEEDQGATITITVSAAASLSDVLQELKTLFEENHPNIQITYNFGSSGALQQQILQGAPVDLFFSAAEDKMTELIEMGQVDPANRVDLIGNEIVLVIPQTSSQNIRSFQDLKEQARVVSIGTPESVPAGKYAKEMLEHIGVWNELEDKMVYAKDVRQVLMYVETGNVDAGIVYKTDAISSSKVQVVMSAEEGTHAPILYPLGIINDRPHDQEVALFYQFLQTDQAKTVFEKFGFTPLRP